MRYAPVMALMALLLATTAVAGLNPFATLPLHGKTSSFEQCNGYLPVDCSLSNPPQVNMPAPGPVAIFLFVNNYTRVAGVQTAFQKDPSWTFTFGLWDCQPNQLSAVTPGGAFGPTAGTISTAFDCLNGPALGVIGRMHFVATTGCITQVQSTYPDGNHVVDCSQGKDLIDLAQRLGSVCVGQGGHNACPAVTPVEPATWGSIKAQYN